MMTGQLPNSNDKNTKGMEHLRTPNNRTHIHIYNGIEYCSVVIYNHRIGLYVIVLMGVIRHRLRSTGSISNRLGSQDTCCKYT